MKLLKYQPDVNSKDSFNSTVLHLVSTYNYKEIVTELLKHRANPNFKDNSNITPLYLASELGYNEIVVELKKTLVRLGNRCAD